MAFWSSCLFEDEDHLRSFYINKWKKMSIFFSSSWLSLPAVISALGTQKKMFVVSESSAQIAGQDPGFCLFVGVERDGDWFKCSL